MKIKIVSLDLDNTLIKNLSVPEIFYKILLENNIHINIEKISSSWNSISNRIELELKSLPIPISKKTLLQYYIDLNYKILCKIGVKDYKIAREVYNKWFKWSKLYNDAIPFLKFLDKNKYIIVVSSNNLSDDVYRVLKNMSIINVFKHVFTPDKIGFLKFYPQFYRKIIEFFNVSGGEILHVGDSLKNDYIPAIKAGLNSILLNRSNKTYNKNIKSIRNLIELANFLED